MRKKRGFTLIELLVVIGIIGVLAGLIFPVYSKAMAQSQKTQCISNQRQLIMALQMYAQDHEGRFPFMTKDRVKLGFDSDNATTISGQLIEDLDPYTKNKEIFYCPVAYSFKPIYSYVYQSSKIRDFNTIGYYYFCGDYLNSPEITVTSVRDGGDPRRILLMDVGGGGDEDKPEGFGRSGHGYGQAIYTFADGHSKFINEYRYPHTPNDSDFTNISQLLLPNFTHTGM